MCKYIFKIVIINVDCSNNNINFININYVSKLFKDNFNYKVIYILNICY